MKFWANFIAYQSVWFIVVMSASHGLSWPGICAAVLFVSVQLIFSNYRLADFRLLIAALLCGLMLDSSMAALGWVRYATTIQSVPLWMLALWGAFALTLNHSLAYLKSRPLLAGVLGGVGGPMAYWSAARGWQVIQWEQPVWYGVFALGIGWAFILPVLTRLAYYWTKESA